MNRSPGDSDAFLIPLTGPTIQPVRVMPRPGGAIIGRHEPCDILLPANAEKVSRQHARLTCQAGEWLIADLSSRWGTYVNGVKLSPSVDVLLKEGDLVHIAPWTFTFSRQVPTGGLQASDDLGQTMVRSIVADPSRSMADAMLSLLLESAATLHNATNEKTLAEAIINMALRGTRLQNAAFLKPIDANGRIEIVAARFADAKSDHHEIQFSRSLMVAASQGTAAELVLGNDAPVSQSIVQLQISSALCVPLTLGATVAAYLYLDSRNTPASSLPAGASAFCLALGRVASLALANLKRVEMEKRDAILHAELAAAAMAQKWIMPTRHSRFGPLAMIGESRPGQFVGGDFFDIIPIDEYRVAIALGDVCGKGVSASVLMTATQGFLHASLLAGKEPATAVGELNRFIQARTPDNRFVTMWLGVIDITSKTLTYVDAGHSYAIKKREDHSITQLNLGAGLPIGIDETFEYSSETISFAVGESLLVVSDGIIEQFNDAGAALLPDREQFGIEGVRNQVILAAEDPVRVLFEAVIHHAGTSRLADDATAVFAKWA